MKFRILIFLFIMFSSNSYAEFWFGPCCSGATCGIIPCDGACSGAAFVELGSAIGEGYLEATKTTLEINTALASCNTTSVSYLSMLNSQFKSSFDMWYQNLDKLMLSLKLSFEEFEKNTIFQENRYFDQIASMLTSRKDQESHETVDSSVGRNFKSPAFETHLVESSKKYQSTKPNSNDLKESIKRLSNIVIAEKETTEQNHQRTKYITSIATTHAVKASNAIIKMNNNDYITEDEIKSILILLASQSDNPNIDLSLMPELTSNFKGDGYVFKNAETEVILENAMSELIDGLLITDNTSANRSSLVFGEISNAQLMNYLKLKKYRVMKERLNEVH